MKLNHILLSAVATSVLIAQDTRGIVPEEVLKSRPQPKPGAAGIGAAEEALEDTTRDLRTHARSSVLHLDRQ